MTRPKKRTPGEVGTSSQALKGTDNASIVDDDAAATQATAEFWASRIVAAHTSSVRAIIETGRELVAAKARLAHGEWGRLTGETTRQPLLPFGWATAQRLMQIAENPVLSNPAHCAGLPASWGTLATLAKLPAQVIEQHLAGGAVFADMTRAQAEELVQEWRIESTPHSEPPPQEPPPQNPPPKPPPAGESAAKEAQAAWERAESARREAHREARRERRAENESWKGFFNFGAGASSGAISKDDFKLILGCLHPDHQPDERKAKFTKAFQIFKDLEGRLVGTK